MLEIEYITIYMSSPTNILRLRDSWLVTKTNPCLNLSSQLLPESFSKRVSPTIFQKNGFWEMRPLSTFIAISINSEEEKFTQTKKKSRKEK